MNPTKRRRFPRVDRLLTYNEAAERMGCSPSTVRRLARDGTLPVVRLRLNVIRLPESGIDAYISSCLTGGDE